MDAKRTASPSLGSLRWKRGRDALPRVQAGQQVGPTGLMEKGENC